MPLEHFFYNFNNISNTNAYTIPCNLKQTENCAVAHADTLNFTMSQQFFSHLSKTPSKYHEHNTRSFNG